MATAVCYAEIRAKCGCASSLLTFTLLYKLSRAFYKQETGPERARDFPKVTQPECMKLESELSSTHESTSMGAHSVGVSKVVWRASREGSPFHRE